MKPRELTSAIIEAAALAKYAIKTRRYDWASGRLDKILYHASELQDRYDLNKLQDLMPELSKHQALKLEKGD